MDANGNKVQTLRQQFENKKYEKVENTAGATTFNKFPSSILKSPTKGDRGHKGDEILGTLTHRDLRPTNATTNPSKNEIQSVSSSLGKSTNNKVAEDNRRNGIYVSNSVTLSGFQPHQHPPSLDLHPSQNAHIIPPSLKRKPMVLDLHQVGNEGFIDEMIEGGNFGKGGLGNGDDLSLTSSSSSTCVNLRNYGDGDENGGKEIEPQALTPTSNSSSASSGSGYGKVKRSNAFRASNTNPVPTPKEDNGPKDGNDSCFVNKSKLVLERVKSLDTASGSSSKSGSSNSTFPNEHPSVGLTTPAQRAASVCLRPSQSSSQFYDTKLQSSPSAQILATNTGKAVNIVTPYQVSDIYTQIRKGSGEKQTQPLPPQEVEYAVPIITRKSSQRNDGFCRGTPISPPKIPPAPSIYPPSTVLSKDQIGLPGSSDGSGSPYSFLARRRCSPYEEMSKGQGQLQHHHPEIILKRSCIGGAPHALVDNESASSSSVNSTPSSSKAFPPSKPPRTFLYDILTDHRQAATSQQNQPQSRRASNNSNTNLPNPTGSSNPNGSNPSELYMEASSTKKKTVTVADSLSDKNNSGSLLTQNSNRNANQIPNQTLANNGSSSSNVNPKRQYSSSSSSSTLTSSTTSYKQPVSGRGNISVSTATVRQTNKSNSNLLLSRNANQNPLNNANGGNNQKSKSASTIHSSSSTSQPNENPGSSGNGSNFTISSKRGVDLPVVYTITANHHPPLVRSKTESQLVVKSKNNWNSENPESIPQPSGIHHATASATMSNYDYGYKTLANAPPFHPSVQPNSTSNYYSPPHHHQSQNLLNNQQLYDGLPQYRSNTNLLKYNNRYPSNPGLYQASWKDRENGLPPTNNNPRYPNPRVYPSHNHNQRQAAAPPHFHDHRSNSLMYMTTEIDLKNGHPQNKSSEGGNPNNSANGLSVFNATNSVNVNRCSSDDRLCERSKSDWALNHVHTINPSPSPGGVVGRRRNTVTLTPGGNSTGHPSLESTTSSNVSSSTPQPNPNNGTNSNNSSAKKPGIQQSVRTN